MSTAPGTRISGQLHVGTLDQVGGRIVGGDLVAGTVLTLDRLAREYAVSVSVAASGVMVVVSSDIGSLPARGLDLRCRRGARYVRDRLSPL